MSAFGKAPATAEVGLPTELKVALAHLRRTQTWWAGHAVLCAALCDEHTAHVEGAVAVTLEFGSGIDETALNKLGSEPQQVCLRTSVFFAKARMPPNKRLHSETQIAEKVFCQVGSWQPQWLEIPYERLCLKLFNPSFAQCVLCLCQKRFLDLVPDLAERSNVGGRFFFNQHNVKDVARG